MTQFLFDYRRGRKPPPVVEDPIGATASLHQGTDKTLYGSCCCVNAVGTAPLCRPPRQKVMSFAALLADGTGVPSLQPLPAQPYISPPLGGELCMRRGRSTDWREARRTDGGIKKGAALSRRSVGGGYLLSHFRSTIGVVRLNFSVRNGKRWNPHAITTLMPSAVVGLRTLP